MVNVLKLTLKKKWFDMILSGEKKFEYRDIKPYFFQRLMACGNSIEWQVIDEILSDLKNVNRRHRCLDDLLSYFNVTFRNYDLIEFRNGYAKDSPKMVIEFCGTGIGLGVLEHGAPVGRNVFMIGLGEIVKVENINAKT